MYSSEQKSIEGNKWTQFNINLHLPIFPTSLSFYQAKCDISQGRYKPFAKNVSSFDNVLNLEKYISDKIKGGK